MVSMERKDLYRNRGFIIKVFSIFVLPLVWACTHPHRDKLIEEKPKNVPKLYLDAGDPLFSRRQDTVFYKGLRFSGRVYTLFPNRDTCFVFSYLHGLKEGMQIQFYPNKIKLEERTYADGKKEGIQKGWWPNGKLKFFFQTHQDDYSGLFKQWYESGILERDFHYKDGHENGYEKAWWPDGKIRANYFIRNGEKFGLFGQRLCVNNSKLSFK